MNLPQQWERVTIDGKNALGSKMPKKAGNVNKISSKTVANSSKGDILKESIKKPITPITDNAINRVPKVDIDEIKKRDEKYAKLFNDN